MPPEKLFSYGTLQYETVQLATFGRKLIGTEDILLGYQISTVKIGEDIHHILIPTHNPKDRIKGKVFNITPEELQQADAYEISAYRRIRTPLLSGNKAWVYVCADHSLKER